MAWIVKLVSIGAAGAERSTEVMQIARPDDLTDLATLGLTLAEGKQLLAGVQQELVAAQARRHAAHRPACRSCCSTTCRVKDYRQHAIATLFGQVAVRLPRYCCVGCGVGVTTRSVQNRTLSRKPNKFSAFHKRSFMNRFRLSGKS